MGLKTPRAIQIEHSELHKELTQVIGLGGEIGKAARAVAAALHPHFVKEEKYAMPQLGILPDLAEGKTPKDKLRAIRLSAKLQKESRHMLKEHQVILAKLEQLKRAAGKVKNKEVAHFAKKLMLHAKTEEEVLYPASILVGKYLKNSRA